MQTSKSLCCNGFVIPFNKLSWYVDWKTNMPFPSQIGKFLHDLPTPCLVVSKSAYENNCKEMLEKAEKMGVQLRGQTKTHKTIEGGILQTGGSKR